MGKATRALDEVRRLASGLRLLALDDLGLVPALERLVHDYEAMHGIRVETRLTCLEEGKLSEAVATALYRIVQEAMGNVAQHALARTVWLSAGLAGAELELTIEDDGCGFDPAVAASVVEKGHLGIVGMRERAGLLNGTVNIDSRPGLGTRVRVRLPVEREADEQIPHSVS